MIVRICHETGCRIRLSTYNPTDRCWEHRKLPRRLKEELDGKHIQRDDDWLFHSRMLGLHPDATIETWRPHMMSETFTDGMTRREMSDKDKETYRSGDWL
jgi:hypothetical protein